MQKHLPHPLRGWKAPGDSRQKTMWAAPGQPPGGTRPQIQTLRGAREHMHWRRGGEATKNTQGPQLALPLTRHHDLSKPLLVLLPPFPQQLSNGHNTCHFTLVIRRELMKSHTYLKVKLLARYLTYRKYPATVNCCSLQLGKTLYDSNTL